MARHFYPQLKQNNLVVLQPPRPHMKLSALKLSRLASKITGTRELLKDSRDRRIGHGVKDFDEHPLAESKPITTVGNALEVLDGQAFWGWDYKIHSAKLDDEEHEYWFKHKGNSEQLPHRIRAMLNDGRLIIARTSHGVYWYNADLRLLEKWQPESEVNCMRVSPFNAFSLVCLAGNALILKGEMPSVLAHLDQVFYGVDCGIGPYEYLLHDYKSANMYDARMAKPSLLLTCPLYDCTVIQKTCEIAVLGSNSTDLYDLRFLPQPVLQYPHANSDNPPTYFLKSEDSLFGVVRKPPANLIEFPLRQPDLSDSAKVCRAMFRILEGSSMYSYDQFKQKLYAKSIDNIGYYDCSQKLTGVAMVDGSDGRLFLQADHEGGLYISSDVANLKGCTPTTNWFERFSVSKRLEADEPTDLVCDEKAPYKVYSVREEYNLLKHNEDSFLEAGFTSIDSILPATKHPMIEDWKEVQTTSPMYEDIEDD